VLAGGFGLPVSFAPSGSSGQPAGLHSRSLGRDKIPETLLAIIIPPSKSHNRYQAQKGHTQKRYTALSRLCTFSWMIVIWMITF